MNGSNKEKGYLDPEFLRKLERLSLIAHKVQLGAAKGERRSKKKGVSIDFADYREYVQGDDLRHVDWNIFARLDAFHLKLFQEQEDMTLHILIDASRSMGFGSPPKIEFAAKLAAAIGYIGLAGYDRVSVESFSGVSARSIRPLRGRAAAGRLFSFLGSLEAEGHTDLEAACKTHFMKSRAKGVAVLISDFFDPAGPENGLRRLALSGSDLYAIQVLAPEEYEPEISGDLKLVDCETGDMVEVTVSPALMKRYEQRRDEYIEQVRKACLARGIGHFVTQSNHPVDRLTLELLRRGGMVK